jgi:CO/xanthine dehydrogenase Mo-binding subunit
MASMIGKSIPRFDAIAKAWDAALYPSDIPVSDPYILKTVFTPVPHARVIVEEKSEEGPFGAKGMGEIPFGPFAPAWCPAVHDACGAWFNSLPLNPEKVNLKLAQD